MHVCLVTSAPLPPQEGLGYHVWNLAREITREGHRADIITRGTLRRTVEERLDGITVWRVPFVPLYPFHVHVHSRFVNRLVRRMEGQWDIINEHTPLPPVITTKIPIVTTVHSPMVADTAATHGFDLHAVAIRLQTPVSRQIETAIFQRSAKITAVAHWVAQALEAYGVDKGQVAITGNGVEDCFLDQVATDRVEPIVLYTGRLVLGKGLPELVEAASIVAEQFQDPALRFILVGDGNLHPDLCQRVRQAGLESQFEFRGAIGPDRRSELVQLYRQAQIFVLPSHHEGMPTALLEAMATGLPVISTAVGGSLEVIVSGDNGLMVPPREPKALAQALLTLLRDSSLRRCLGKAGRKTVEEHYSWNAVGRRYVACYEQVANGRG